MEKTQAIELVRKTLTQPFEKERFNKFVRELLHRFDPPPSQQMTVPDAFANHVRSCQRLGTYHSPNGELLDILIVNVSEDYKIERTRTALRDFVAHKLKRGDNYKEAGLVAFVPPSGENWRFSFVRMEYESVRDPKTGKIKPEERLTPARRYSYLVGVSERSHTAQKQLVPLLLDDSRDPELSALEQAFGVEKVTKEFFSEYARLFETTEKALSDLVKKDKALRTEFENKHVNSVDFTKKLLGQIVFLYFIQKKGWLGVPKAGEWGVGPRDFLRRLASQAVSKKQSLFNDILEPLFYDTLATDRGHEAWCKTFQCRIPFLNGGLFEPLSGYDWENTEIHFPNSLFTNNERSPQDDIGTGILDIFDRYNFTVNEAEPLEKEVAIDPEMLGKVFENLIEENRRKGLGAFYTPREIVHYMCQESLINYLDSGLNHPLKPIGRDTPLPENQSSLFHNSDENQPSPTGQQEFMEAGHRALVGREDLEKWIHQSDQFAHYAAAIAAGTKGEHYPKPPESIRKYAREIDELLRDITVCDPAIGSGAFPVGMMTEVVRARTALTPYFNDIAERTAYHFKRHAIQNSLYGVDIDVGAVEIAKLRLWLSLVVDEEDVQQIKPLPNLDYKIVVGNSLLGVEKNLFNHEQFRRLEELKPKFFNESDRKKKTQFKKQIEDLIHDLTNGREVFDFEIYFSEVFHTKDGFDVVIGNPPYVGQSGNKDIFREVLKTGFGKRYHQRRMDYFYFFFHKGLLLARSTGIVNFITTNYYLTATYADKVRQHMKESAVVLGVVNFEKVKLFHSAQGQHNAITMLVKDWPGNLDAEVSVTRRQGNVDGETLSAILRGKDVETSYARISNQQLFDGPLNCIRLVTDRNNDEQSLQSILSKIRHGGPPLITVAEIVQGIVTGANQATERQIQKYGLSATAGDGIFVLSEDEVLSLHLSKRESDFIKPWYKNSDIDKWVTSRETEKRLVYIRADSEFDNAETPNLLKHFRKFKPLLVNRNIRTGSITVKQYDDFVSGKSDVPYVMIKSAFVAGRFFCVSYARDEYVFTGEKIVCPQFSPLNTFAFDNRAWFAASDVYFIKKIRGSEIELRYLLGLLNSKLCYFWLYHKGQRKGDLLQLFKGPLSEIPIARPPSDQAEAIITVVGRILAAKQCDAGADVSELERELNELVYALYGLTKEEIEIVEGAGT